MDPAVAIVVILGSAIIGSAGGVAAFWWSQRSPAIGRRVVANLIDGSAIRGILFRQRGPWLVLHDASYLSADPTASAVSADGTVHLERPRVLFLQVLS